MQNGVETDSFAAPLLLIIHIISNTGILNKKSPSLNFDEKTAYLWFKKFTYYAERELIGRIVGKTIDNTNEMVEQLMTND